MPAFSLHFFESAVTPEGPVPVAAWVSYWRELHGGFEGGAGGHGGRDGAWDAFMANSLTFYAPDLTPFVRGLRGAGATLSAVNSWRLQKLHAAFCILLFGPVV